MKLLSILIIIVLFGGLYLYSYWYDFVYDDGAIEGMKEKKKKFVVLLVKKFVVLLIILTIIIVVLFGGIYLYNLVNDDATDTTTPLQRELEAFNAKFIDYGGSYKTVAEIEELVALINSSNIAEKESARGLYVTLTDGTGENYVHTNITERVYKDDYEFATEDDEEYTVTLYYGTDGAVIEVEITK